MSWALSNLLSFLERFCVDESITQADLINFIELRYGRIYNKSLKFYKTERTFATVSGTKYYYLPRDLNVALGVKFFNQSSRNVPISECDYDYILSRDPDESQTGFPIRAAFVELSTVQRQPSETSDDGTLKIKSSDSNDTSQKVTITGRATVGGQQVEITEELTLTGTSAVTSVNTWVYIYSISKSDNTAGYVTVTDSTDTYVYAIIDPYRDRSEYQKWRLWPTPNSADTIKITGHRKPIVPQNNSATLDVSTDLEAAFIQGLRADVHDANFDMVKAQKYESLFEQGLEEKIGNNTWGDDAEMSLADKEYRYNPLANVEDVDEDLG